MSFPFNFTKISKDRHFTATGSKILQLLPDTIFDTSFQNTVLVSLQLFFFVCYKVFLSYVRWNKTATSMACNFHNNWPLDFKFLETKNVWRNIWLMENKKCQVFSLLKQNAGTIWNKRFWQNICPVENRNVWLPLQSAIIWKREFLQLHLLIFFLILPSFYISSTISLSVLQAIQKNSYFLIYKAW